MHSFSEGLDLIFQNCSFCPCFFIKDILYQYLLQRGKYFLKIYFYAVTDTSINFMVVVKEQETDLCISHFSRKFVFSYELLNYYFQYFSRKTFVKLSFVLVAQSFAISFESSLSHFGNIIYKMA